MKTNLSKHQDYKNNPLNCSNVKEKQSSPLLPLLGFFQPSILQWPFVNKHTHTHTCTGPVQSRGFGPRGRSPETALFNKLLIFDAGGRRALFNNNDNVCSIID